MALSTLIISDGISRRAEDVNVNKAALRWRQYRTCWHRLVESRHNVRRRRNAVSTCWWLRSVCQVASSARWCVWWWNSLPRRISALTWHPFASTRAEFHRTARYCAYTNMDGGCSCSRRHVIRAVINLISSRRAHHLLCTCATSCVVRRGLRGRWRSGGRTRSAHQRINDVCGAAARRRIARRTNVCSSFSLFFFNGCAQTAST